MRARTFDSIARCSLWKLGYLFVAGTFLFMGLERRFALPLVPILDIDSTNFLWPGLLKLNGGGFVHTAGLNFIYPGLLFVLLRVFGDFRAIVIFQHLLGVGAGLFYLLAWNRLRAWESDSFLGNAVHAAIGLFGAGIYLLSPIPIMFELHIRPEAVCMFVQMMSFWLLLQFLFYRKTSAAARKTVVYGVATVGSVLLLQALKPSFTLTALFTIALLVALVLRSKLTWKSRSIFLLGAVALALLFIVPEQLLGRGDRLKEMFLPQTLFAVHARIIDAQIGDDLVHGAADPFPQPWLKEAHEALGLELARLKVAAGQFSVLGFDPDYLMNGERSIFARWRDQLGSDAALKQFLTYYYWRTVREKPGAIATKIAEQMSQFYNWDCPAFLSYRRILLRPWSYEPSLATITAADNWAELGHNAAGLRLRGQTEALLSRETVFNSGKRLFLFHRLLARGYFPVLLISLSVVLWLVVIKRQPASRAWPSLLVAFFFLTNFGNVLGVSSVHSMEIVRYSTVQFAAVLFAELWAIRYLLGFVLGWFEERRRSSA